jgi:hypothetical protein
MHISQKIQCTLLVVLMKRWSVEDYGCHVTQIWNRLLSVRKLETGNLENNPHTLEALLNKLWNIIHVPLLVCSITHKPTVISSWACRAVMLLTCIREVSVRILVRTLAILTEGFVSSSVPPGKCQNSTLIRSWSLPSKSFLITFFQILSNHFLTNPFRSLPSKSFPITSLQILSDHFLPNPFWSLPPKSFLITSFQILSDHFLPNAFWSLPSKSFPITSFQILSNHFLPNPFRSLP